MRIADALDMYEDTDAREDGYAYVVKRKGYRRARTERREAAQKAREEKA